jgi:hypothetical protein
VDTYTVEFRIESRVLVPSEVTSLLNLQPSQTRDINITEGSNTRHIPLWAYDGFNVESNHEWESLEDGLIYLLDQLQPKKDLIWSKFGEFDMYWWCGHFQQSFDGGPTFSPKLFIRLADFGVPLILKNYLSCESK